MKCCYDEFQVKYGFCGSTPYEATILVDSNTTHWSFTCHRFSVIHVIKAVMIIIIRAVPCLSNQFNI